MNFLEKFPTKEQVASFINSLDREDETTHKAMQQRMENYYNCIDDYSYGGICDKAAEQRLIRNRCARQALKEQLENGKPFIEEFEQDVLCDLQGNIVSERTIQGRYGEAWVTKDGEFVNVVKNRQTYARKGYQVWTRIYIVEYYYTTQMTKIGLWAVSRIVNIKLEEREKTRARTKVASVVYFAENFSK